MSKYWDDDDDEHDYLVAHLQEPDQPSTSASLVFWVLLLVLFVCDVASTGFMIGAYHFVPLLLACAIVAAVWKAACLALGTYGLLRSNHRCLTAYQIMRGIQLVSMAVILLTFAVVLTMMVSDETTTNRIELAAQGMGIVWWLLDLIYAPLVAVSIVVAHRIKNPISNRSVHAAAMSTPMLYM